MVITSILAKLTALVRRRAGRNRDEALTTLFSVWQDLRYAGRSFTRRPLFAIIGVASIALGIGAAAVVFSWVDTLLLSPLGSVRDQRELRVVHATSLGRDNLSLSYPGYLDIRDGRGAAIADIGVYRMVPATMRTAGGDERVFGELVSTNMFELLRVQTVLGRPLLSTDDGRGDGPVAAVLSYDFWQRRFSGRRDILDAPLTLNGRAFIAVGVAEPGFRGAETVLAVDIFVPIGAAPVFFPDGRLHERGHGWLNAILRTAPEASDAAVQAELEVIAARLGRDFPAEHGQRSLRSYPLWRAPSGGTALLLPVLALLAGVVLLLLLLTSANVAGLVLVRVAGRQRELAVRQALGASRGRVARQLLTEVMLLNALGGLGGISVARWSGQILLAFIPPLPVPLHVDAGLNLQVLIVGLVVTTVSGLLVGAAPALQAWKAALVPDRHQTNGIPVGPGRRARQWLVVSQVALALVLLVSASLFVRAATAARSIDTGFSARQGLMASLDLVPLGYDADGARHVLDRVTQAIAALPGVDDVTVARRPPLTTIGSSDRRVEIDGYVAAAAEDMSIFYNQIAPRFFSTLRIPLVEGRDFGPADTATAAPVAIVNQTMARRYWPGRSAVGGRIRMEGRWVQVVGIAADSKDRGLTDPIRPFMYLPLAQSSPPDLRLIVRTSGDPSPVVAPVRAAIARVDPRLPMFDVISLEEHIAFSLSLFNLLRTLLMSFGGTALALAAIGLYGTMALHVGQRTNEIGIRLSLGATRGDIGRLVARQALTLLAAGLAIGFALATGVTRLFQSQLAGVSPLDPASYGLTLLTLLVAAAGACALPIARAVRVQPVRALRME